MMATITDLVSFLQDFALRHPACKKGVIATATTDHFHLEKKRSLYTCSTFSIRFATTKLSSFPNWFLSLSALRPRDHLPVILCIVRHVGIELLLVNSTFLKKVSHASQKLRTDNIVGGFLGSDILREFDGTQNTPTNFVSLFSIHSEFTWKENLARLVEATNNIAPTGVRFEPSPDECARILSAADLAASLAKHPDYAALNTQLAAIAENRKDRLLQAAANDNGNERGNAIEQIITEGANVHGLEDLSFVLKIGITVLVDVKSKMLARSSMPKAYNIDKLLRKLAQGGIAFSFFFVGIDVRTRSLSSRLVSILDQTILAATKIRFHWAGRNSRGVTQLTGDLSSLFKANFVESVDVAQAKLFLQGLIDLKSSG